MTTTDVVGLVRTGWDRYHDTSEKDWDGTPRAEVRVADEGTVEVGDDLAPPLVRTGPNRYHD